MVMLEFKYSATFVSESVIEQPAAERSAEASESSNACSTVKSVSISVKSISKIRPEKMFFLPFFSTVKSPA